MISSALGETDPWPGRTGPGGAPPAPYGGYRQV